MSGRPGFRPKPAHPIVRLTGIHRFVVRFGGGGDARCLRFAFMPWSGSAWSSMVARGLLFEPIVVVPGGGSNQLVVDGLELCHVPLCLPHGLQAHRR